jgi:CRP-like cAMP-binding protein
VLLEGTVTIERGKKARDAGPGECFGELALLTTDAVRTARVRAKTPVRCLAVTRADFKQLLTDDPKLSLAVLETVAARLAGQG